MAPGLGIEPRLTESKSVVLPLHNPGINLATIFVILIQANDDSLKLVATQLGSS